MKLRFALVTAITLWIYSLPATSEPTLELIMSDPDWIGNAPEGAYWSDSGDWIYFQQKRSGEQIRDLYRVAATGGDSIAVPPDQAAQSSNASRVYDRDRTRVAWVHGGDVLVKDLDSGDITQITRTSDAESSPMFMADGQSVAFLRDSQYFVYDLASGLTWQPADLRFEKAPDQPEDFDALRDQQMRTFATLREDQRQSDALRDHQKEVQKQDPRQASLPIYLGDEYAEAGLALSPSGRFVLLAVQSAKAERGQEGKMPNYVTESRV